MSDKNAPYIVPVNFVFVPHDTWGTVYIHSARQGRKIDFLRNNPRVCLEIDFPGETIPPSGGRPCDTGFAYTSLIGEGTIRECREQDEIVRGLKLLTKKYTGMDAEFTGEQTRTVTVLAVELQTVTGKSNQ